MRYSRPKTPCSYSYSTSLTTYYHHNLYYNHYFYDYVYDTMFSPPTTQLLSRMRRAARTSSVASPTRTATTATAQPLRTLGRNSMCSRRTTPARSRAVWGAGGEGEAYGFIRYTHRSPERGYRTPGSV